MVVVEDTIHQKGHSDRRVLFHVVAAKRKYAGEGEVDEIFHHDEGTLDVEVAHSLKGAIHSRTEEDLGKIFSPGLAPQQEDDRIHYPHLSTRAVAVAGVNTQQASIDLGCDAGDIGDAAAVVVEVEEEREEAADALGDAGRGAGQAAHYYPTDYCATCLGVVQHSADSLDSAESPHIFEDRYLMDVELEDRRSFPFPSCASTPPVVLRPNSMNYLIRMHGYTRQ